MADLAEQTAFDIGRRIDIRGSDAWVAVLKPSGKDDEPLKDFTAELSALLGAPVRVIDGAGSSVEGLRASFHQPDDDPVVVTGLDDADAEAWRALDINRSGLARRGPVILWLSNAGVAALCRHAPNIKSFVGGSIIALSHHGAAMTPQERRERVADLESHYAMSSDEVTRMAKSGRLPGDPEFVEWLILLGRGDLV